MSMLSRFATTGGVAETIYADDVFSTWLYTGNGSSQTITNNIDLSGKGGMVWTKRRSDAVDHDVRDSARSFGTSRLGTNLTTGTTTAGTTFTASSTGYSIVNSDAGGTSNASNQLYVSWTFRKAEKFFDVVTYTGTGSARTISHNLGSVPGCIIVKRTDTTGDWQVYHRSLANTEYLVLNSTAAKQTGATRWNSTTPTSTDFSLGTDATVNANGGTYVAYLFAHDAGGFGDDGTQSIISCGSFTTDGSGNATVSLGYEPQWVMSKRSSGTAGWEIFDAMRGMTAASLDDALLYANTTAAEIQGTNLIAPNATGFSVSNEFASSTYIYIAIRRPNKVPTSGSSVFSPTVYTGTNVDNRLVNTGIVTDMVWARQRTSTTVAGFVVGDRLQGNPYLTTGANSSQVNDADSLMTPTSGYGNAWSANNGFGCGNDATSQLNVNTTANNHIAEAFKRAPGFFDVVAYTGSGGGVSKTINHGLGVTPELIIVKQRNVSGAWEVYFGNPGAYVRLDSVSEATYGDTDRWNNTAPTSSVFTVGAGASVNTSGGNYSAYLFATCPGVSKVGTYIGAGVGTVNQIDCGFSSGARFVMIKRIDSSSQWFLWDSARGLVAGNDPYLRVGSSLAEITGADYVDTTSTGFELSTTATSDLNDAPTATWISQTSGFGTSDIFGVTYGNGLYVAGGKSAKLSTSTDGVTWTSRTSGFVSDDINAVAYGNGLYVAGGNDARLTTSTDGVTWTSRTSGFVFRAIRGLAYGNGLYVAVGTSGYLTTSTDGVTWTLRTSGFGTTTIRGVTYGNGLFVAVGDNGKITTSTDGITWTLQSGTGSSQFSGATYGNGLYVAVGISGTMYTSTDGVTWTSRTSGFGANNILGVTYGNGFYVAVGANGTMTVSTDGITWTSRTSGFSATDIYGVTYGNGLFVAGGGSAKMTTSSDPTYLYLAIA